MKSIESDQPRYFRRIKPRMVKTRMKATMRGKEPPLPMPFPLPTNFRSEIMAALKQEVLSPSLRRKFLSAIASAIFRHKGYPTKEEYNHVGQQVIEKYPFLCTKDGCGYVSI